MMLGVDENTEAAKDDSARFTRVSVFLLGVDGMCICDSNSRAVSSQQIFSSAEQSLRDS